MLPVHDFHPADEIRLAALPSMVHIKKGFALGDHRVVMSDRAAHGQRSPFGLAPGNASRKFPCAGAATLVKTPGNARGPMRRPLRREARPFVVIRTREIEKVVVLAEPQFVF